MGKCLAEYRSFGEEKSSLLNALKTTRDFMNSQGKPLNRELEEQKFDGIKSSLPNASAFAKSLGGGKSGEMVKQLESFVKEVEDQIKGMEDQVASLENQISKGYDSLNASKYHLHSMIIHDGNAESGHYFNYIKDHASNKWVRFSDIQVKTVEEAEVMKDSFGGSGWRSAYWVVYINDSIYKKL